MAAPENPGPDQLLESFTVMRGVVRGPGDGVLALCENELLAQKVEHSIILRIAQGKPTLIAKLKWETRALFIGPQDQVLCVGARGRSATINPGVSVEAIGDGLDEPGVVGLIRDATRIDSGVVYAVALDGRLYAKPAKGAWTLAIPKSKGVRLQHLAQGAVTEENLLAASIDGDVYRKSGDRWQRVDVPTSGIVNFIWMSGGDRYVACGLHGLLLMGAHDQAQVIEHSFMHEDFWSTCSFGGEVYVSSLRHLYRLLPAGDLERVDPLDAPSFHLLSASADTLWSLGARDVLELHDAQWKRLL
jgi:hypothetical protein